MGYKIAVVGPIPRDTITTHLGEVIQKYGCLTHPSIALSKLLTENDEVIPIANIHLEDHKSILHLFSPYSNINTESISSKNNQGTIIDLKFIDQNNRIEKQISKMEPIGIDHVEPHLNVDAFVFVPITNFEVELEALKFIKANSQAKIVFDAHGPTSYVNKNGDRLRCFWEEKDDWLPYIDVLKMNLEESLCCWFDMDYNQDSFYDENNTSHLDSFAKYVLSKGVQHLYITLDSRGCILYYLENNVMYQKFINSVPVSNVIDTTGCGDSFAGGLAFGFMKYNDAIKAAQFANVLGARRTQGKGFDVFKTLEETEQIIRTTY